MFFPFSHISLLIFIHEGMVFSNKIDTHVASILFVFLELFLHAFPQPVGEALFSKIDTALLKRDCADGLLQILTAT